MAQYIYINISLQGIVYHTGRRTDDNDAMLQLFRKNLADIPREFSLDALYNGLPFAWHQQDDIANPFGDHRECLVSAVWIIDLDNDILQLQKKDQSRRIPLRNLRQGPISLDDLEPYDPAPLARCSLDQYFAKPNWEPRCHASERRTAFIGRMLEDFSYQWRHVLRSRYNNPTFRRLARAIIRIVTLDFQVDEITYVRPNGLGPTVPLKDLPRWDFFPNHIIHLGGISIVLCQHLTHCMSAIRRDFGPRQQKRWKHWTPGMPEGSVTYLVLSVREVFLYKINMGSPEIPRYTKPEPLFNGIDSPSQRAIEYLLMAMPSSPLITPIHNLPVEIQDMVLEGVSVGPVEAARVGCRLALGSTFSWATGKHSIERQAVFRIRHARSYVESQIRFDGFFSGLVYR